MKTFTIILVVALAAGVCAQFSIPSWFSQYFGGGYQQPSYYPRPESYYPQPEGYYPRPEGYYPYPPGPFPPPPPPPPPTPAPTCAPCATGTYRPAGAACTVACVACATADPACLAPRTWNVQTCSCGCPTPCAANFVQIPATCACVCNIARCVNGLAVNPTTCTCPPF